MNAPLRTLIVDDEELARERLRELLAERADAALAGEAPNGRAAVEAVRAEREAGRPLDLVLLDVQMPELDGLGVLDALAPEERPAVVFVTAFDRYALRAFDLHALDYLLKPFDDGRFHRALDRAVARLRDGDGDALTSRLLHLLRTAAEAGTPADVEPTPEAPAEHLERLAIRVGSRWVLVEADELDWVEGAGVYARLVAGEKDYLLRMSLTELEERLDPARFARVHRSTIVNLGRIREVRPHTHGEYVLVLKDGTRLKASRTYSDRVRTYLDRLS